MCCAVLFNKRYCCVYVSVIVVQFPLSCGKQTQGKYTAAASCCSPQSSAPSYRPSATRRVEDEKLFKEIVRHLNLGRTTAEMQGG